MRAGIWEQSQNWQRAIEEYRAVLRIDSSHREARIAMAGNMLLQLNQVQEACREFQSCLEDYPDDVSAAVLDKLGPPPAKGGAAERYDAVVAWTGRVLREYVLPELRPAVVVNWLTEPDHTQHALGAGSPEARASIRNADRHIARLLERVDANVIVASDHGFSLNTGTVNVTRELVDAGVKTAPDSDDVVVASSGQAMGVYVKGREAVAAARSAVAVDNLVDGSGGFAEQFLQRVGSRGGHGAAQHGPDLIFEVRLIRRRGNERRRFTGQRMRTNAVEQPCAAIFPLFARHGRHNDLAVAADKT